MKKQEIEDEFDGRIIAAIAVFSASWLVGMVSFIVLVGLFLADKIG